MLLKNYSKEIFKPTCNSNFQSLHCIAHLDEDIGEALPYLNAVLDGDSFIKEPTSLTFKMNGKLVTLHSRKIAVNALKDEAEADHVLEWLRQELNDAWENREKITPKYTSKAKPHILDIYKLLPKTNCRECGQPTCMMFASLATEGIKGSVDCARLSGDGAQALETYLSKFSFA